MEISEKVFIGTNCRISSNAIVGFLTDDSQVGLETVIGDNVVIEPFAVIYAGARIDNGSRIMTHVVVYPNVSIGEYCVIANGAHIREKVIVGNNSSIGNSTLILPESYLEQQVRIHALCEIAEYTRILEGAWIGPGVLMFNTIHPKAYDCGGHKAQCDKEGAPVIGRFARIGGGAIINPFVRIGDYAVVGSGAVVTKSVAEGMLAMGFPAREVGKASELGCRYDDFTHAYDRTKLEGEKK
ncbi:hypothetical protein J4437_06025 [Candidatus Woesearchaeota archaeon]|nr:hypothetical protein [Candidatus Woesearchaeota archaeon]